ncbi:hypothetical protein V2S66_18930 [Streptomyces sp. V4-01]|uniref:Uncharacterized protein n=1 Tax=Actinacidiphila polyblastidii TaxID=3110430 RepID=A0ABU7PDZ2_9ACTN|nr:hypothetical protein [Streptomyces sp. V4-01]
MLAEGGVLDAVRALLDTTIHFVDQQAEATGRTQDRSAYTLWHLLCACADHLDAQAADLHRAPQLLHGLTTSGTPAETRPGAAPEPCRPQDWVPPAAIIETPAALEAITALLDRGTVSAPLLVAPVLDPDDGVLARMSDLLASASRYAQRHGGAPELWQDLGRASQHLGDISETLADSVTGLATLPGVTRRPAPAARKPPTPPAPDPARGAGDAAGRRR